MSTYNKREADPGAGEKWNFEYTVFHKRRYIARFFEQDEPDYINTTKKRLSAIQQALELNKSALMHEVLLAGIEKMEDEIREGSKGNIPAVGTDARRTWAIAQKYREISEKRRMIAELEPIYAAEGVEGFRKWCEENGINPEPFLKHFTWLSDDLPNAERYRDFLYQYLGPLPSGAPRHKIREAAEKAGIITDDNEWECMRKLGERMGLQDADSRYGHWKWK